MDKVSKAKLIANIAHKAINQKRKYTGLDYIIHPAEVVNILKFNGIVDEDILSAAWLHDVVEDTGITLKFLKKHIGYEVTEIVEMVTDISKPEDGNREIRKRIDREHYKTADYRGKIVKLADIISNGIDIQVHDPNFSVVYFREIKLLLPYLEDSNRKLYNHAYVMIEDYYASSEKNRLQEALK